MQGQFFPPSFVRPARHGAGGLPLMDSDRLPIGASLPDALVGSLLTIVFR